MHLCQQCWQGLYSSATDDRRACPGLARGCPSQLAACAMLCRVSTTGLLLLLTAAYPHLQLYFMLLVTLDLASHWYQMYATLAAGGITHKVQGTISANLLLLHKATQGCFLTRQLLLLPAISGLCLAAAAGGHLTSALCCFSFLDVTAWWSTMTAPAHAITSAFRMHAADAPTACLLSLQAQAALSCASSTV